MFAYRFFCFSVTLFSYFKDGLKTIAHFGTYIDDLSSKLQNIKQKQDEERRRLLELRTLLRSTPDFDRVEVLKLHRKIFIINNFTFFFHFQFLV